MVSVIRYYRPEDIDPNLAHSASFWDVIASTTKCSIDPNSVIGRCHIVAKGQRKGREEFVFCDSHQALDCSSVLSPLQSVFFSDIYSILVTLLGVV